MAVVGIDIGGTMIKAGVVDLKGKIHQKMQTKTPYDSYEGLLETLSQIVKWGEAYSRERFDVPIAGIALSMPCATDPITGESLSEGALGYILGKNPAKDLGAIFAVPYSAENDGNCAALAEVWLGSAQAFKDVVCVVSGTGIGGAVVKNRQIHHGSKLFAGEIGMCVTGFDQETGRPLTWSKEGSTIALVRCYAQRAGLPEDAVDGKSVFEKADQGDVTARTCVESFYKHFAVGLHNIQHVFDPERILIGGGISGRPELLDEINRALDAFYEDFDLLYSRPIVGRCTFEADANLIGAVYHWTRSCYTV